MPLPILDSPYKGKPMDWSYSKIQMLGKEVLAYPPAYKNPYAKCLAPRDQAFRGTCVGQSTAYCYDLMYMTLTKDIPTNEDISCYKKNVTDSIGTLHDELFPQSASAESFYQESRKIGNVTYPSGSEIRFASRAWCNYGMNLETQWHTDKNGTCVWMLPPGARQTQDGGISPEDAAMFAALHKAEGWAQVGTPGGNCTWEQVCSAIATKGFVLGAIPIYENYSTMEGGDGSFPDPRGELAGFHALCFYGYDEKNLYLVHSWGDWCGMYGSISYEFFRNTIDLIQFFVILDSTEVVIARGNHSSCQVTSNVPAHLTVNGIMIGDLPQKVSIEKGLKYTMTVSADGYYANTRSVDESVTEWNVILEPIPVHKKNWLELIIEFIRSLFSWT